MGIKGKDFVMLCGDTTAVQQIITIKHDEDKLRQVDSHKIMALAGEPGDRVQFSEFIMANVRLYALRNGQQLTTDAVANYTRGELATALRKVMHATTFKAILQLLPVVREHQIVWCRNHTKSTYSLLALMRELELACTGWTILQQCTR